MKKLLLTTLTCVIASLLIVGCNEPTETCNQLNSKSTNHQEKDDHKHSNENVTKENITQSKNENTINEKSSPSKPLNLTRIDTIDTADSYPQYLFEPLGDYSTNKLKYPPEKDTYSAGFIVSNNLSENSNLNNFKYNELITSFGHIKYPNFLKLDKGSVPASGSGFNFQDSNNKIDFHFGCHVPFPNVDGSPGTRNINDIYKSLTNPYTKDVKITYKSKGKDWACVSYEEKDIISYNFVQLDKDLERYFGYSYPKKYKEKFDSIIQETYKSFKIDNLIK